LRKFLALGLFLGLMLTMPTAADAQGQCKNGARVTLSGTIQKIDNMEPEPGQRIWILTPQGTATGPCTVKQIWGRGRPPAACAQGKSFSASGKVVDAESFILLQIDSASCK
jgi:hypothetical protein